MTLPTAETMLTRAALPLTLALVLLVFLILMGACTSEEATPVGLAEPTVESAAVPQQTASGTGQPLRSGMQGPQVGDAVTDGCTRVPSLDMLDCCDFYRAIWDRERYIRWSLDGSRILFQGFAHVLDFVGSFGLDWPVPDLYSVTPDGIRLDRIVDVGNEGVDLRWYYRDQANRDPIREDEAMLVYTRQIVNAPGRNPIWGDGGLMMYFDISPDGSQIVYSTCAYTEDAGRLQTSSGELVVSDIQNPEDTERKETARGWVYNYEIVLSDIDGGNTKRLTTNFHPDNFPVWSPDGSKIAFIRSKPAGDQISIYTVATDSFHGIALPSGSSFLEHPLSWSPDGKFIAFVGEPDATRIPNRDSASVFVTEANSTREWEIWWAAASGPAWSPDGQRIAMVVPRPDGVGLYTFAVNGTDPVFITDNLPDPWDLPINPWLGDLAWSPDGSEILLKGFTYRVPLDGSPPIGSPLTFIDWDGNSQVEIPMDAVWSPDGSSLAVRINEWFLWQWDPHRPLSDYSSLVFLVDRDNTNIRPLVEIAEIEGRPSSPEVELRLAE